MPFDNDQAERGVRIPKFQQKISDEPPPVIVQAGSFKSIPAQQQYCWVAGDSSPQLLWAGYSRAVPSADDGLNQPTHSRGRQFDRLTGFSRRTTMNQFRLIQAVDRFSQRVVVAVSLAVDGRLDACLGQRFAVANADAQGTRVVVMDQRSVIVRPASVQRLLKCIQNELRDHRRAIAPADDAWAKKALANFRISLARRNSLTSRASALRRSRSDVVTPSRSPLSTSSRLTRPGNVWLVPPIFGPIDSIAERCDCGGHSMSALEQMDHLFLLIAGPRKTG